MRNPRVRLLKLTICEGRDEQNPLAQDIFKLTIGEGLDKLNMLAVEMFQQTSAFITSVSTIEKDDVDLHKIGDKTLITRNPHLQPFINGGWP